LGRITFADCDVVVGVEDCGDGFCALLFADTGFVVSGIEFLEIEFSGWFSRPQTEIVGRLVSISRDYNVNIDPTKGGSTWDIMGNCFNHLSTLPNMTSLAIIIATLLALSEDQVRVRKLSDPSAEPDGDFNVVTRDFPRIVKSQPVIREFCLISIDDLLFKDSVVVANSIAHGGDGKGSKRIKETSSKTSETSVSQRCIRFLFKNVLHIYRAQFLQTLYTRYSWPQKSYTRCKILHANVEHGIIQRPPHKKLQRQI